jgi:hypothetical protein
MEFILSEGGLLVHSRTDWPCAVCNPSVIRESRGFCLCVHCARNLLLAASAGVEDARALIGEITDALVSLECQSSRQTMTLN